MQPPPQTPDRPVEIVMRRSPWWMGGRFREVSRRYARPYDHLPLWARIGFMIPMGVPALMTLVAVALAALGGAGLLWAVLEADAL